MYPKKINILITVFILLLSCQYSLGQRGLQKYNSLFAELGGNGLLVSANYERRLLKKPDLSVRIGIGKYGIDKFTTVPFGLDYNLPLGKKNNSFLDFGFGLTYTKAVVDLYVIVERRALTSIPKEYYLIPIPSVQYKYAGKRGFLFKTGLFFPIRDIGVIPYIGFSFGAYF